MAVDDVWKETVDRLNRRENPKWESLSWVALRPLISSLNDQINRAAPELVDDLRRSWMQKILARQGAGTIDDYQGIVDRSETESFLLMGDTGEQDASQYVLGPALRAAMRRPGGDGTGADFLVICSDVIYPSGDINDYPHGFYLPYEDLLYPASFTSTETNTPQRIYAVPGNHDWYDGLTGFMHTFCGLDRLGPDSYVWQASWRRKLTSPEIAGRMLWRRPSRPLPIQLRDRTTTMSVTALREERMGRFDPRTSQPGPYYAIQLKGLLLVCIDGGIGQHGDCMIDADQGRWLLHVSRSPQPKVLLTGYPLLVNGEWKSCRIKWEPETPKYFPRTVNEIVVDPAHGYVASIGGDLHNFQYYDVQVGDPDVEHRVRYLVSGGGGAYVSATHPGPGALARVVAALGGEAPAVRARNALVGGPATPHDPLRRLGPPPNADDHPLIPPPERSLSRFAEQVLPKTWRLIRSLIAFVVAAVLGTVLVRTVPGFTPGQGQLERSDRVLTAVLGLIGAALAYRVFVLGPPRVLELESNSRAHTRRRRRYRRGITAFAAVAGFAVPLIAARVGPDSWFGYLVTWELLTGLGVLLAILQRFSGWWREPAGDGSADHPISAALVTVLALVLVPLVLHQTEVAPFTGGRRGWIAAAALCVVAPAGLGWLFRTRPDWRSWSRWVAPLAQVIAAMVLLAALPEAGSRLRPIAVLSALLMTVGLVLLAVAATMLLIARPVLVAGLLGVNLLLWWTFDPPTAQGPLVIGALMVALLLGWALATRRTTRPQLRLARYGRFALSVIALLVPAALIGLTVISERLGSMGEAPAFLRLVTVVAWGATLTSLGVLGIDTLRRTRPAHYRGQSLAAGIVGIAAITLVPLENRWLAAGLVVTGLGLILATITIALAYLAFLGGHTLLFDRAAHQDLEDRPRERGPDGALHLRYLIDEDQARQVIDWRQSEGRHPITDHRLERRAKFVTPSTDKPEGLIQHKVSEFFSTDRPPFSQHFLQVRVRSSVPDPTLEITPRLVTGDATAGTEPGVTISIPLPRAT